MFVDFPFCTDSDKGKCLNWILLLSNLDLTYFQGFSDARAEEVVEKTWQDKQETLQIKTLGNLKELFQR